MAQTNLEARVAQLEEQMAALLKRSNEQSIHEPGRDEWKLTIGMFDGDPVMEEVIQETLKVREQDRKRTRP